jgi:adhesin transport system membrane fusion protein
VNDLSNEFDITQGIRMPPRKPGLLERLNATHGPRLVITLIGAGFALFLVWSMLAQVDEVTHGQGRVIPTSKMQVIQSADPATIREILVRSGQQVQKGQLLVRLDDTQSSSELGQLEAENNALEARAARLGGEGQGQGQSTTCQPGPDGKIPTACQNEQALHQARESTMRSKLAALGASVEQKRRDLGEAQATVNSLHGSIALAQKQVDLLEPLAAKSIVPQTELLQARRELVDLQGRLAAAQQGVARSAASIQEAQAQSSEAGSQFRQEALDERNQITAKIAVNTQSLRGATGKLQRSEIRSPVRGVVNDVQVTTIGGFVSPGQKIMEVVPLGEKLLVETRVKPNDIAFIRVGDKALVKVTAYDFSIYGGLEAKVVQVSADSIYDDQTKEAYFTVIVETDKNYLEKGGKQLPITPGMICDVQIITGHKSILRYLLKPVIKAKAEALTER